MNFNWLKNKHSIRFGADFYRAGLNHAQAEFITGGFGAQGGFGFDRGITERCEVIDPSIRQLPADLRRLPLQQRGSVRARPGRPSRQNAAGAGRILVRSNPFSFYIRDRWTVGDNLTLDYGTRWEYFPMPTRPDRGIERYDPTTNKVLLCGIGDVPEDCGIKSSKTLFAPRVGAAYRITIRGSSALAGA